VDVIGTSYSSGLSTVTVLFAVSTAVTVKIWARMCMFSIGNAVPVAFCCS
jgi:hypothetical protein